MSQIVDYDSTDLEKPVPTRGTSTRCSAKAPPKTTRSDLSSVELSHYRLRVLKQQDLLLVRDGHQGLHAGSDVGTRKARDKKEEFLSLIIARLNDVFVSDGLTENDLLDYARTITNKVSENEAVMHQIRNNSAEQALLGDFASAVDNAVMESADAHQNQMNQVLSNKNVAGRSPASCSICWWPK